MIFSISHDVLSGISNLKLGSTTTSVVLLQTYCKMILFGIDCGVTTGVGVWDARHKEVLDIKTGTLPEMYGYIRRFAETFNDDFVLRIEDARKRKWFGNNSNSKIQGAGSIKRDSQLWEQICEYEGWKYQLIHPIKGATKLKHEQFCRITKWDGRTNEHGRDATMLVYGLGRLNI